MNKNRLLCATAMLSFVGAVRAEPATVSELDPVLVTAPLPEETSESLVPFSVLQGDVLNAKKGRSIGETLKNELGITSQSFGPGVGSPVIRGQAEPRVKVMQNGIGNNDLSALSPDHANGVEIYAAERIEVLRGPAALLYGNVALGGVVNVVDNRIPGFQAERLFSSFLEQRYDTAVDETTTALQAEGGQGHWAYHLDGFYRTRGTTEIGGLAIDERAVRATEPGRTTWENLKNTHGFIDNTQAQTIGGAAGFSYVGAAGFLGVAINHLENHYGIPPDGTDEASLRIALKQTKYDFKGEWQHPLAFLEALRCRFGYTDYRHVELEGGRIGTTWRNETYESRLELAHEPWGPVRGVMGIQSIHSDFNALGKEAAVPKSQIDTDSLFAFESLVLGPLTYRFGARVEHQRIVPEGLASREDWPVSGSASVTWDVDTHHQVSLAFTQAQRAPQVQELYAHGVHHATRSFEIGNPHLGKEVAYNLDLGYRYSHAWGRAEANLYHAWVNDYIYLQRTGTLHAGAEADGHGHDGDLPILESRQADALFKGFEGKLIFPLVENTRYGLLDLTLFGDYSRGEFTRDQDVPRMPPLRYGLQLDHRLEDWTSYVRVTHAKAQRAPGEWESPTDGYVLLGLGTQYRVTIARDAQLMVFARGNNLLNENIRNATSYLRHYAPEPGRGAEVGLRIDYR